MKHVISPDNPFGSTPKGLAFEVVKAGGVRGRHLDYGAHSGDLIAALARAGLITSGIGVDVNKEAVQAFGPNMPPNVRLEAIQKHAPLPFEAESFDTISIIGVIEHVHEQVRLLSQLVAALKPDGYMLVAVPGQHVFSVFDMGNFKFRFPRLHRLVYSAMHSPEQYRHRYVNCANGLFGDVEVEKMWHEHFSVASMTRLLDQVGMRVTAVDGQGLFQRLLVNVAYFTGGRRGLLKKVIDWDAKRFSSSELVFVARKR